MSVGNLELCLFLNGWAGRPVGQFSTISEYSAQREGPPLRQG